MSLAPHEVADTIKGAVRNILTTLEKLPNSNDPAKQAIKDGILKEVKKCLSGIEDVQRQYDRDFQNANNGPSMSASRHH